MPAATALDRARWLGHRWRAHGFAGEAAWDDLLLLGFQDSRGDGARQSLRVRADRESADRTVTPTGPLVVWWTVRGAPHAHRLGHMNFLRAALAPVESDEGGADYVDAVTEVAAALGEVVVAPIGKGEASAAVTGRVSRKHIAWCERCGAEHVDDAVFRAAGRQAQLVLGTEDTRATTLYPTPPHPDSGRPGSRGELLRAFFRVNGPITRPLFRDWLGAGVDEAWRDPDLALVRVRVDGHRYELPERLLDEIVTAPPAEGVALVPAHDPYLRQTDRALLVPDTARRAQVWRAVSAPGAILVDGEVAGTWRYRRTDHRMTLTPFDPLPTRVRTDAEEAAHRTTGDDRLEPDWA